MDRESLKNRAIEIIKKVNATPGNNRFHSYQIERDIGYMEAILHILNTDEKEIYNKISFNIESVANDYEKENLL